MKFVEAEGDALPKGQLDTLAIDIDIGDVVFENGRDVDFREHALGEDDEQAGLAAGTIACIRERGRKKHGKRSIMVSDVWSE